MKKLIGAGLLASLCGTAQADLVVSLQSEKNDFIGQGVTQTLTYSPANTTATVDSSGNINVSGSGGAHQFQIRLSPLRGVSGATLSAGMCYDRAQRAPFRDPGRPGIDATMDGRGCNSEMGRFRVRELAVNGTQVQTLAVDFSQSCKLEGGPALFGNIRLNSSIPATTPFTEAAYDATGSLQFTTTGSGIGSTAPGGAANIAITRALLIAARNPASGVSLNYTGPLPGQTGDRLWWLLLAGPNNSLIVPGDYLNIEHYPSQSAGHPGFDFSYNFATTNTVSGGFHVDNATYDSYDGLPQDFDTTFILNRDGNNADRTTGTLSYHATFRNGGPADEIFPNGFEDGQIAPATQTSLAYACP